MKERIGWIVVVIFLLFSCIANHITIGENKSAIKDYKATITEWQDATEEWKKACQIWKDLYLKCNEIGSLTSPTTSLFRGRYRD